MIGPDLDEFWVQGRARRHRSRKVGQIGWPPAVVVGPRQDRRARGQVRRSQARAAGQAQQPDRDLQAGALGDVVKRCAQLGAADRQRRVAWSPTSGDIDMRLERLLEAAQASSTAPRSASSRSTPNHRLIERLAAPGRRDRRVGAASTSSPGCCSTRRASLEGEQLPDPPKPSPDGSRCCWNGITSCGLRPMFSRCASV